MTEASVIDDEEGWAHILRFCDALKATGRPCGYNDGTPECEKANARNRPCYFNIGRVLKWMDRNEPERSWTEKWGNRPDCEIGAKDT